MRIIQKKKSKGGIGIFQKNNSNNIFKERYFRFDNKREEERQEMGGKRISISSHYSINFFKKEDSHQYQYQIYPLIYLIK